MTLNGENVAFPDPNLFHLERSLQICSLCNNSSFKKDITGKVTYVGDPTGSNSDLFLVLTAETACLVGAMTGGITKEKMCEKGGWTFVSEHAFDSTRKRMSVVYTYAEGAGSEANLPSKKGKGKDKGNDKGKETEKVTGSKKYYVLAKGGCESILSICTHQNLKSKKPLTDEYKAKIEKQVSFLFNYLLFWNFADNEGRQSRQQRSPCPRSWI